MPAKVGIAVAVGLLALLPTALLAQEKVFFFNIDSEESPNDTQALEQRMESIGGRLSKVDFEPKEATDYEQGDAGLIKLRVGRPDQGMEVESGLFPQPQAPTSFRVSCEFCSNEKELTSLLRELVGLTFFNPKYGHIPPMELERCRPAGGRSFEAHIKVSDPTLIDDKLHCILYEKLDGEKFQVLGARTEYFEFTLGETGDKVTLVPRVTLTHFQGVCGEQTEYAGRDFYLVMWPQPPRSRVDFHHSFARSRVAPLFPSRQE